MNENTTNMNIYANLVITLRNQKAWSQHHLAEVCGLSLRTIQRVEKSAKGSQETVKAFASVFELQPAELLLLENDKKQMPELNNFQPESSFGVKARKQLLLSASALMTALALIIWVPVTSASDVDIQADSAVMNDDTSETYIGNVIISIPSNMNTEILGKTMWTAGNSSFFEGEVNVEIGLNGQKYFMQSAVVDLGLK